MTDRHALLTVLADTLVPAVDGRRRRRGRGLPSPLRLRPWSARAARRRRAHPHAPLLAELEKSGFAVAPEAERLALLPEIGASGGAVRQPARVERCGDGALLRLADESRARALSGRLSVFRAPSRLRRPPSRRRRRSPSSSSSGPSQRCSADVCVVGSGAGGGGYRRRAAAGGPAVVVLERAGYRNEPDFRQLQAVAAPRAVPARRPLLVGDGLDRAPRGRDPRRRHRDQLAGLPAPACRDPRGMGGDRPRGARRARRSTQHLDAVSKRIDVNTERPTPNRVNQLMAEALEARGLSWRSSRRTRPRTTIPTYCGYCNAGCQQGCKHSTLATYLQDASDAGARIVVDCAPERVLVRDRRAAGVVASGSGPGRGAGGADRRGALRRRGGRRDRVAGPASPLRDRRPRGRQVPAPAPDAFLGGVYDEDVQPWSGQFQALVSFDFADDGASSSSP